MSHTLIENTIVRIVPEICVASIAAKSVEEMVCWMLLRHIDTKMNHGAGKVRRSVAISYLSKKMNLTDRRVRQIINDGMGTFWRSGSGDWLYMMGMMRLCDTLGVRNLISRYVEIPYGVIADDLSRTRPLISAIAACSFTKPTAVGYIAKACGLSKRTIQRHFADASDLLIVRRNVLLLHQTSDQETASEIAHSAYASGAYPSGSIGMRVTTSGMFCVIREMANTYDFISGRASYGRLRSRLNRRRGVVRKKRHGEDFVKPTEAYKNSGIMKLMDISGWTGLATELTEVWEENAN